MASDSGGLGSRLLGAVRGYLAERDTAADQDVDAGGWLDVAAERFRHSASILRFVGSAGRDQLVGVGESYEVSAELGALRGQLAERIRFFGNGELLGEATLGEGAAAYLLVRADEAGTLVVTHEALGPRGVVLLEAASAPRTVVRVVGPEPVAIVDSDLLLDDTSSRETLRALAARGVTLSYVDLADERRKDAIQEAIVAGGLPKSAIISHPKGEADFGTWGVDFRSVFIKHSARRSIAGGAAIVALITGHKERWRSCQVEGIGAYSPAEVSDGLADGSLLTTFTRAAEALHEQRSRVDALTYRLDRTTRTKLVHGNECGVELDNGIARESVLEAIEGAERSVSVQLYILEDGRFTDHLGVRLIAAARRGVRVRLLVDGLYSRQNVLGMTNPVAEGLDAEPGIEVRANAPISTTDDIEAQSLKERDHRKLILVDDTLAFVSGRNAGDHYYTGFDEVPVTDWTPHERIPWLDAHIVLRGPLVAEIERSFAEAWAETGADEIPEPATPPAIGAIAARFVVHHGVGDAVGMAAYEALLDAAESHVLILNDFPIASTLVAAVRRALGRGVEVTLITGNAVPRRSDGTFFRGPLHREVFEYVTKRRLEPLMLRGMSVYEFATAKGLPMVVSRGGVVRPYVHAKLMTMDGAAVSVGSANLDATASYWEREANVVVQDADFVHALEVRLRELIAQSFRVEVDSDYWRKERAVREIASRLWPDAMYS